MYHPTISTLRNLHEELHVLFQLFDAFKKARLLCFPQFLYQFLGSPLGQAVSILFHANLPFLVQFQHPRPAYLSKADAGRWNTSYRKTPFLVSCILSRTAVDRGIGIHPHRFGPVEF
jgi:hypothetical protein